MMGAAYSHVLLFLIINIIFRKNDRYDDHSEMINYSGRNTRKINRNDISIFIMVTSAESARGLHYSTFFQ